MYFAAFDPFMRAFHDEPVTYRAVMDAPPYRFGRIGYAWLTRLVSLGDWRRFPATMVWLVLGAVAAVSLAVTLAARAAGASAAWGLLVIVVPGFWQSLQTALPEPIAAAFLVFGFLAWVRGRWLAAALFFATSLLVRETGAVLVLVLAGAMFLRGDRKSSILMTAIAALPVVTWHLYMGSVLFPDWGFEGFFYNPHDLGVPFLGFADLWKTVFRGEYMPAINRSAIWYPIVLTSGWLLALTAAIVRRTPLAIATTIYATVAISLNYESIWVHVGNGQRGTYETFVLLALVSVGLVRLSRGWRIGVSAFWGLTAAYVLWLGFDAPFIRDSILSSFWLSA